VEGVEYGCLGVGQKRGTHEQVGVPQWKIPGPQRFTDVITVGIKVGKDIQAGQNAGMATVAAAYGYIAPGDDPRNWGADLIAADTAELTQILLKAVNLGA